MLARPSPQARETSCSRHASWLPLVMAVALAALSLRCSSGSPAGGGGHPGGASGGASAGTGGVTGDTGGATGGGMTGGVGGKASSGGAGGPGGGAGQSASSGGTAGSAPGRGGNTVPGAGGAGGAPRTSRYLIGADVTNAQRASSTAQDQLFAALAAHGFNAIRARTFVDPKAADGYDKTDGTADLAHTVAWGQRIKRQGFSFLLDFHYSDNWADPSKQCVPLSWQSLTSVADLARAVHDYTKDVVTRLVAAGARPDMVQVGNEITPGMLIHRCDSTGTPTGMNPVGGSNASWKDLGMLLKAGIQAVREVDPTIAVMLHIEKCNDLTTSKWWIDNALAQGLSFDVFGQSCYQTYQGDPTSVPNTVAAWTSTFAKLAAAYPSLSFVAAEYGPLQRELNDVVFGMAAARGLGTFNWEPESEGDWNRGHTLFSWTNDSFQPQPDLQLYDAMKKDYAARL